MIRYQTYQPLIRPNAILEAGNLDRSGIEQRQDLPATLIDAAELPDTVVAAVDVGLVCEAGLFDEFGEPEVRDAALAALCAPVLAQLLHHAAAAQAPVAVDLDGSEVEALDYDRRGCGAEGVHFAPGGVVAQHGLVLWGAEVVWAPALGCAIAVPDLGVHDAWAVVVDVGADVGRDGVLGIVDAAYAAEEALEEELDEWVDERRRDARDHHLAIGATRDEGALTTILAARARCGGGEVGLTFALLRGSVDVAGGVNLALDWGAGKAIASALVDNHVAACVLV